MDIRALYSQPLRLTPAELQADALLSLENRERYFLQSENTSINALAPLPSRDQARRREGRSDVQHAGHATTRLTRSGKQTLVVAV